MRPWLEDPDVTLYHGDVLDVLREMEAESVDCVVTSPPYEQRPPAVAMEDPEWKQQDC